MSTQEVFRSEKNTSNQERFPSFLFGFKDLSHLDKENKSLWISVISGVKATLYTPGQQLKSIFIRSGNLNVRQRQFMSRFQKSLTQILTQK